MTERFETVIVGSGPAGLATSYHLTQFGRKHILLERGKQAGNAWRNERWNSFTLVTPNWAIQLPGAEYDGPDPDGYLSREQILAYLDQYIEHFQLPILYNARVTSVELVDSQSYRVQTPGRTYEANNVVIATGFFQQPKIPPFATAFSPDIKQLHSSTYREPESLPTGAVLVVGTGQSGCQIAEELYQHGRKVFLSTGSAGRLPRRYRGKDIIDWLNRCGVFDLTPEQLPPGMGKFEGIPHLSGTNEGHTLNLHQFACDGVVLLGHLQGASGDRVRFAPDLYDNLAKADQFEREALNMINDYIHANGLNAPMEEVIQLSDGYEQPVIEELDLKAAGIRTIIWAMGYTFDYSLVKLPVCDNEGFPIQTRGVTRYPGLYFAGMPWMPTERSGFLIGVGEATKHIASAIAAPAPSTVMTERKGE